MEHEKKERKKSKWLRLFIIGILTYIIGIGILLITGNSHLFPSIILLGNFLIPVTYVAFLYERRHLSNVNMTNILAAFFYGGFLGTFSAAILEPIFIRRLDFRNALVIGVIEEFAKVFGAYALIRNKRYSLEIDGIILGAAAGMGFAALESSGYAFTEYMNSGGSLSTLLTITIFRGIFSPLAHGTWTAILTGVLLREKVKSGMRFNSLVLAAYLLVVILHGLWDGIPSLVSQYMPPDQAVFLGYLIVGVIGLVVLYRLWSEAREQACEKLKLLT